MSTRVESPSALREFGRGIALLGRGFTGWGRRPGLMALGLIPAAIVSIAAGAALIALITQLPALSEAMTPFARNWPTVWVVLLRIILGAATFGGALALVIVSFTALSLIVGEPFYDRIWKATEKELTGSVPAFEQGFWRSTGDALVLLMKGIGVGLLCFAIGLIPAVGSIAATVIGVVLTGRLLADELAARALTARGFDRRGRRALLRSARARVLGFGVATQLCFLIPLGAILTMPAAVVGATALAVQLTPRKAAPRLE